MLACDKMEFKEIEPTMKLDDFDFGNLQGNELVKQPKKEETSILRNLGNIYDEHARLLFLFDVSGSMGDRVTQAKNGGNYIDQYDWSRLAQIRADAFAAIARLNSEAFTGIPAQ